MVDVALLNGLVFLPINLIIGQVSDAVSPGFVAVAAVDGFWGAATPVISVTYFWLMTYYEGTTVGGKLLRIEVRSQYGGALTSQQAGKRSIVPGIVAIPYLGIIVGIVAGIWGLIAISRTPLRQVPWDKFGETVVVEKPITGYSEDTAH